MGQKPDPKKRPPFTRLHTVIVLALIMFIVTLASFFSNDAEATRSDKDQAIKLNEQALTQIHASVTAQEIPETNISHKVQLSETSEQDEKHASQNDDTLNQTEISVKSGYSLSAIFKKHRFSHQDLFRIMQTGKAAKTLLNLQVGHNLSVASNDQGHIYSLSYEIDNLKTIDVNRIDDDFTIDINSKPVEKRISFSSGQIQNSLFEAGKKAGLSDALVMEMAGLFGWDIDFALDIRQGDKFSILYEEQFVDGVKYNTETILAAEFTNNGKTFEAIRFTDKSGRTNYYTPKGLSMRKTFLRSPVDFRRISSRFGKRRHPILNKMRVHKGVDYAARRGTPILSSGDGRVVFRGRKGGYGRVVIVQHGSRYQTLYAHMNSFNRKARLGRTVKQGQVIGYVGSSGRATGPHLHYEFRVNGSHRNPLTVRLPNAAPIKSAFKEDFVAHAERIMSQLDTNKPTQVALTDQ